MKKQNNNPNPRLFELENKIKIVAQALIEQQKYSQICEQTMKELEKVATQLERY